MFILRVNFFAYLTEMKFSTSLIHVIFLQYAGIKKDFPSSLLN